MSDVYADDLFPEKEKFADDLFPASVDTENARKKLGASPMQDYIFSREKASVARTLSHFGQGFKEAWGHEPLGKLSDGAEKYLKSSGWFNDYDAGQRDISKAANEVLFRPAAMLLDAGEAGWRLLGGAIRGTQQAIAGTGEDLGQKQLGRDLAAHIEAFGAHPRPFVGMTGVPQVTALGERVAQSGETLLLRARAAKVIGHGEEGWRGVATEAAEAKPARSVMADVAPAAAIDQPLPKEDVNTVARGIAPDLFTKYDDAQVRRDTFRDQLNELDSMRAKDAAQAAEIENLKTQLQEKVRAAETEARELAPAVREAYVEAKKADPEAATVVPEKPPASPEIPGPPIEQQRAFIMNDVAERLVAAGRSQTEAQAAAAIDAAYWETRAARFKGAKGSAEEMYRREAPEILGPGMQSDYHVPRAAPKRERMSLLQFIASKGGIRDNDPLVSDVRTSLGTKNKLVPGFGALIRKDGMTLDRLREAAIEAGYLSDEAARSGREASTTINSLLEAIDTEVRGRKVHRIGDDAEAAFDRDSHIHAIETELDGALRDNGIDTSRVPSEVFDRAIKIMDKDGVRDPLEALERAGLSAELYQSERKAARELIIQHNVTAENLLHAEKIGGIPVPSLAITKASDSMTNFGEITLIGPKEMADPRGGTRVYGADIYSPRYPTVHYKIDGARLSALEKELEKYSGKKTRKYLDSDSIRQEGVRALERDDRVMASYLDNAGLKELSDDVQGGKKGIWEVERSLTPRQKDDFRQYIQDMFDGLDPTERIFKGFTYSGNRSYRPHTLENVVSALKKDMRAGEGFNYGVGSLRAKYTPQFRSIESIRKNKDRLVSKENFEAIKKEIDGEFWSLAEELRPYSDRGKDFGFGDTLISVMQDASSIGLPRAFKEYGFSEIPHDAMRSVAEFLNKLRDLPTEYFEAKILRGVGIPEFKIAVVPDSLSPKVLDMLESRGVKTATYKAGNDADRKAAVEKITTEMADDVLFQGGEIKRGRIRLREDGQNTITLLKDANASTFIHEKGHDYLSRLVRDADDPLAPIELRTDAETVYRWLGVEKAADIKTRHHEKFARGFENYLMEGRAPSHALARVFEQFRQWLLRIYSEASRLKAPINDEIRGVFDRMLAIEPEQVVIAPDRAPERMAGRHEALADIAPAPTAADAAGMVRAERDIMSGRLPREEQDARLAEIAAGIEGRAPRGAQPDNYGNAPEPVAGGGGIDPQPGAVGAGGGQASFEAPALAAKPVGVRPTTPHASFGPSTEIADKAGNIRLDLLNAPNDVKRIISQVADENEGFQRVRGPVTDVQVAELAEAMGMDATYLSTRKMGEAWTAPQIVALRNLLIQSATDVRDLMKRAANGGENELMAYAEAKTRHLMIQERVSSVTSEAGRALRAFQKQFSKGMEEAQSVGEFLKGATGQTLFQLKREAQLGSSLETPAQVSKFIHDSRKATASEMVQEAWINALLSGPLTHVKNILGNTVVAVLGSAETAAAAGVGKVRAALGNAGERVRAGEVRANLFGLVQGAQDGLIAAKYAFKHEEQYTRAQTLEQHKFQAIPSKRIVLKTYAQGSPEYKARLESIANARARAERLTGKGLAARVEELKSNPTPDMVAEASEKAVEIGGKQIRTPGRMLTAEDEFFKTIAYRQKLNELAYRQATNEGLSGDAFNTRLAQLTMNPPDEMMTAASKHADYQTFTNALGKTGVGIQMFSNSHLLAKMVVPFVRTPLNLLKYANERTPLGMFSREVRANLSGTNGKIAQDTQIARMAIGTSLGIAAMAMAGQGMITGGGPSDKNQKAALMLSGWRPYSIKIGEFYYSYGWIEPFSTIMGISADMADAAKNLSGSDGDEEMGKIASHLFASISKNILAKSSLRGASDIMQAATDPDRFGDRYLQNLAGTIVPAAVAQQARAADEHQREARTVLDALKARIPSLRKDLLPKRDIWGEPIAQDKGLGPDSFSPILAGKLTGDRATKALLDAELFPARLDRKIRGVELTDQQYDDYARVAGRMAKMRVNALISNPGFENAPVEIRSELLRKVITGARDAARSMILMQNQDIIRQAVENKMSAVGR